MLVEQTSSSKEPCQKCGSRPAQLGGRCAPCYVDRYARRLKVAAGHTLHSRMWWMYHAPKFAEALAARVQTIASGLEPGSKDTLIDMFRRGKYRLYRSYHSKQTLEACLMQIINSADRLAEGERNGTGSTSIEEHGGRSI